MYTILNALPSHGGGYSQINAELLLLKLATETDTYCHYHLLSGEDLPIKSNETIYDFFINNKNKEFVAFDDANFKDYDRVKYHYRFQDKLGSGKWYLSYVQQLDIFLQKKLHLSRNNNISFQKGANWFSISDSLARHVVKQSDWIKSIFQNSFCCDEIFLQTLIINSPFINNLYSNDFDDNYESNMRLIDWKRGSPYVFCENDFNEIMNSNRLFARKFQAHKDINIIRKIYNTLSIENS